MTDHQTFLRDIEGFLSTQDQDVPATNVDGLTVDAARSQLLLAEISASMLSPEKVTSTGAVSTKVSKSSRDIAREKAGQRRDAYRRRLKAEWATLRQQEGELNRRLERLKEIRIQEETHSRPNDSLAIGAWKTIAMRQYESRKEAEELQRKLQTAVSSRAVMIQDFQSVLKKRLGETVKEIEEVSDAMKKKTRTEAKNATLYRTYFESLDILYGKLDEVFAEVGTSTTPGMILGGEPTRKMNGETEYFENTGVGRVPFDFKRTSDAVWELSCAPHRQDGRRVYDGLPDSANSKAVEYFSVVRRESGELIKLKTYQVSRRYIEDSRHVLVWRALTEAASEFPGLNLDETGWCVVHKPATEMELLAEPASTLVQACMRLTPMYFQESGPDVADKLGQFMELTVKTVAEDNQEIERMMEKLLLDEVFATDCLGIDEDGNFTSLIL